MRNFLLLAVFLSCSGIKIASQSNHDLPALKEGAEVANVNGTSIREGYFDLLKKLNPRVQAQMQNPMAKKQLVDNLVEQELFYQEAIKRGVDKKAEIDEKAELYRRVIISQTLLEDELKKKAQAYYDANKGKEFTKIEISQIQLNLKKEDGTEATKEALLIKAQEIKLRLDRGEDFGKLAEELSEDKISRRKAGSMGAIGPEDKRFERLGLKAVADTAYKMKINQVSDPIETEKGIHLVLVTSEPKIAPFEEAFRIIRFRLQKEVQTELVNQLKEKATIRFAKSEETPKPPQTPIEPPSLIKPLPLEVSPPAEPISAPTADGIPKPKILTTPENAAP